VYYNKDRIEVTGVIPLYDISLEEYKRKGVPFIDSSVVLDLTSKY